jgi:N-acetylgalactosamine-N,N'-diacetylbacillosaminyl-diphospho-undecaprenol 4-alpha-N-acetylgalactosaminyltransferase
MPGERTRIAFIINSLAGGGAERVFCQLIEGLQDRLRDCDCEVVLLDDEPHAYSPPSSVALRTLAAERRMAISVARLIGEMRRFRPHVAISFLNRANCANVLASRWCGYRAVISERVATSAHFGAGPAGGLKRSITRQLYSRADVVLAVSEGVRRDLVEQCGVPGERIEVIENPVDVDRIRALGAQAPDYQLPERFIVSVNRLIANKNVALQLEGLQRSGLPHHLVILGDGPDRNALQARAEALGLVGRVHLVGFSPNPFAIVARAEMFLSTSNAEGFPNALAEAMALGVPCVSTNCQAGPSEILAGKPRLELAGMHPAEFGVLIPVGDAEACASALRFMSRAEERAKYSRRASERARCYAPEDFIEGYWRAISRMAAQAHEPVHRASHSGQAPAPL